MIIAGGGTAGWMTAAAMGKTLSKVAEVTLVESDAIGTVGVGEATIPSLLTFNRLLGIDEAAFMKSVNGTFKLGIAFENWRELEHRYIHSFGVTGKDHWTAGFQHFWLRGQEMGIAREFGDYCLELVAAEQGKFAHLPKFGLNYAYHIDSSAYASFLREMAESHGVSRREGRIDHVARSQAGDIESIILDDGTRLDGDLFIDCTGFRALLTGDTLGTGYDDWTHWLPCDRAIAVQTTSAGELLPYTRSIAHGAGWRWKIPLQHRTGNGIVFCSRHMGEDEACALLLDSVDGEVLTEPRTIPFRTGTRRGHWKRNCVAIGLSSGFIEPLESTSIHLIQKAVMRLLYLFPKDAGKGTGINAAERDEFNTQMMDEIEHIRDFIILHYHLTDRQDTAFWRYCRAMEVPDSLRHRMALFEQTGRVFRAADELFAENSWTQVMLGQGLSPRTWHPIADMMDRDEITRFLDHIEKNVQGTVAGMPGHAAYIDGYCKAS